MAVKTGEGTVTFSHAKGEKTIRVLWTEETSGRPNLGDRHLRGQSAPVLGMSDGLIGLELLDRKDSVGLDFARGMLRRDSYADKRGTLV